VGGFTASINLQEKRAHLAKVPEFFVANETTRFLCWMRDLALIDQ
jgi:hypothetical protein